MLKNIQNLPEARKKTILWILMVIFCVILVFFFIKITKSNLKDLGSDKLKEGLNFPEIKFPSIDLNLLLPTSTIPVSVTSSLVTSTIEE
jgi:hypothetical protein